MIREIIKPQQTKIIINIPENYINKEIEFIMFPLQKDKKFHNDNISQPQSNITNSLFGALKNININENDYKKYLEDKYL